MAVPEDLILGFEIKGVWMTKQMGKSAQCFSNCSEIYIYLMLGQLKILYICFLLLFNTVFLKMSSLKHVQTSLAYSWASLKKVNWQISLYLLISIPGASYAQWCFSTTALTLLSQGLFCRTIVLKKIINRAQWFYEHATLSCDVKSTEIIPPQKTGLL